MAACSVCLERFDAAERRPKALPCGHTLCQRCISGLQRKMCPVDRKIFKADSLPDNYTVLDIVARAGSAAPALRLWCGLCDAEATKACADEHPSRLSSLQKARLARVKEPLAALRAGELALEGLLAVFKADDLAGDLREPSLRAAKALIAVLDARLKLRLAIEDEEGESVFQEASRAAATVSQEGLVKDAVVVQPALSDPASELSLTLSSNGSVWTAEVRPSEMRAAKILLCQLLCDGKLRPPHAEEELPSAATSPAQESASGADLDPELFARKIAEGFRAAPMQHADGSLDPLIWECAIPGKKGGLWEGGLYPVRMSFSSVDLHAPPRCKFEPPLFHPNINRSGHVWRWSELKKRKSWLSAASIIETLIRLQEFLDTYDFTDLRQAEVYNVYTRSVAEYEARVRSQAASMAPQTKPGGGGGGAL